MVNKYAIAVTANMVTKFAAVEKGPAGREGGVEEVVIDDGEADGVKAGRHILLTDP